MLINKKGSLNREELVKIVDLINEATLELRVPSARVKPKLILDDKLKEKVVNKTILDYEDESINGYDPTAVLSGDTVMVRFPACDYRLEYIVGAWDEYSRRSWSKWQVIAPPLTLGGSMDLDSVKKFISDCKKELTFRIHTLLKEAKLKYTFFVDIEIHCRYDNGNNLDPQNLAIDFSVSIVNI